METLVLASGSPRRKDLLEEASLPFEIHVPEVEEIEDPRMDPVSMTVANALLKARAIAERMPERLVLGADTLVFLDGQPFGKPADLEQALEMVSKLQGRTHEVCTGVALVRGEQEKTFHAITRVTFKALGEDDIRAYHRLIDPLDKAGAYAAQDHGDKIIAKVEGLWSNVVGLPVEDLAVELESLTF